MSFTSQITFLYYNNIEQAEKFFKEVLRLPLIMDQGFAKIYQIHGDAFIGCVKKSEGSIDSSNKGGALISINTSDVDQWYQHVSSFPLPFISEVKLIERIPLKSFFFKDYEGYDFEIQQFIKEKDIEIFSKEL
jgi:hypothetical protein